MCSFAENVDKTTICELELDESKVKQFKEAIENNYWFEFFMGMPFSLLVYLQYAKITIFLLHSLF